MDSRGQLTFYRSYYDALNSLPKKDRLVVYESILAYGLDGVEPNLSGVQLAVFTLIRPTLDTGRRKALGGKIGKPFTKDGEKIPKRKSKDGGKEKEGEKEKEVEKENECYLGSEPDSPSASPVVISLPLNNKTSFDVTEELVSELSDLYPAVDVMQQFRNMAGWLMANPSKRKTKGGIMRFINSWLAREQDKGYSWPQPSAPAKKGTGDALLDLIESGAFDE